MNKQLWFPREEYLARFNKVQKSLREQNIDLFLAFQPESVTYLTGFFTRGYASFQFAIIPVDGDPLVVCRDMEEFYVDWTCAFDNRRLWTDSDDKNAVMIDAITAVGGKNARIGIEKSSWQLNAVRFEALKAGLFFFNHDCGTTLALYADQFADLYQGPIFQERLQGGDDCPGYCLNKDELEPCPAACECAFVREIIQCVKQFPPRGTP